MRRGVFDVLRRGLDNTLANWPLLLLRLGASILYGMIAIAGVIALVVPTLIAIGIRIQNISTPDDVEGAIALLLQQWMILVWIFVGVLLLSLLFVAIHSFLTAGCARVSVDGDRIAGPAIEGLRTRYHVFSMERWLAGGTSGWWTVFWIYNLAWGAAGLILLIPLVPTIALMLVFGQDDPRIAVGTGCVGLVLTLLLAIVVGFVTSMWTNRSIAGWAVRRAGARDALAAGWRAFRDDFGRHILVALAVLVVGFAGSAFFASFSFFAMFGDSIGGSGIFSLMTLPIRMGASILSAAFSAAVSQWYLASYCAIAVEGE